MHVCVFSIPGLRPKDIQASTTPMLFEWANRGAMAGLEPSFPCVTSPVQACMFTGLPPNKHGVIANGFYYRERDDVEFWVGRNDKFVGEQIWNALKKRFPDYTSAVWHAQNIKDASADFIVTPEPIHEPDGKTKLWCYSKPEGTYQRLLDSLGHFPLQHYWGPLSNIDSTRWILRAAHRLFEWHQPNLNWIYLPHLDYAAQKFGPDSPQAQNSVAELDRAIADFVRLMEGASPGKDVAYLAVGEYALTPVNSAIHPNRILREAGLLRVKTLDDGEHIDLAASEAFAMVDHQFAHVYVKSKNGATIKKVWDLFRSTSCVDGVIAGEDRAKVGLNHDRSGDIVLISSDDSWFAYYWWLVDKNAPSFARTVDIHRKPGYDPVELFFDPATKGIPLNAGLVKGSHGVPASGDRHKTVVISSKADSTIAQRKLRDTDMKELVLGLFGK